MSNLNEELAPEDWHDEHFKIDGLRSADCSMSDCDKPVTARDLCPMHYTRLQRYGDPRKRGTRTVDFGTPVQRFWAKVEKTDTCWLWTASCSSNGYGKFYFDDGETYRLRPAHRIAYELTVGPIPDGLHLDHLCRVQTCVRPLHLEPVTCKENIRRGIGPSARNRLKTHCNSGHEFTPENTYTYIYGNHGAVRRYCKTCQALRKQEKS